MLQSFESRPNRSGRLRLGAIRLLLESSVAIEAPDQLCKLATPGVRAATARSGAGERVVPEGMSSIVKRPRCEDQAPRCSHKHTGQVRPPALGTRALLNRDDIGRTRLNERSLINDGGADQIGENERVVLSVDLGRDQTVALHESVSAMMNEMITIPFAPRSNGFAT